MQTQKQNQTLSAEGDAFVKRVVSLPNKPGIDLSPVLAPSIAVSSVFILSLS